MTDNVFTFAALTISDSASAGERAQDASGDAVVEMMRGAGFALAARAVVADEAELIAARLAEWCDAAVADAIITTGGTGLGPRDITPEATRSVLDIEAPGIAEAMRTETLRNTPFAMLSRGVAGVRAGCLIVNLPGSVSGVRETLAVALTSMPHALEMIRGWRTHAAP